MNLDLVGKVAIVTGASRGIGRAIAQALAAEGMQVTLAARTLAQLESLAAALPTESLVAQLDLREPDAPQRLVDATLGKFGRLDALVNNAGATKRGDFHALTDADWKDGFELKFFGAMRCCRAAWPHLAASRGSIVNIAGIGGRTGTRDFALGGAVNAAVMNLTKALADKGKSDGVRVNAINPGAIVTDRLRRRLEQFAEERGVTLEQAESQFAAAQGIPRFGQPAEIGAFVAFLLGSPAAFGHGAIIDVDGGQTQTL
jgi:NAD(P)-dependent dehydrogenase (short-subunit alcohol dehydrogenase family)